MTLFTANQFRTLGGLDALARFDQRDEVFEALRQSTLARQSLLRLRAEQRTSARTLPLTAAAAVVVLLVIAGLSVVQAS